MDVKDLREVLKDMPGEMPVYLVNGYGIRSAKHRFRLNLQTVEQCCELATYFEDHSPDLQDALIERETGFKDRRELLDAYKALLAQGMSAGTAETATQAQGDSPPARSRSDAPNPQQDKPHVG